MYRTVWVVMIFIAMIYIIVMVVCGIACEIDRITTDSIRIIRINRTTIRLVVDLVVHIAIATDMDVAIVQTQYCCCTSGLVASGSAGHFTLVCGDRKL